MKTVNHDDRTHSLLFCTEMKKHLETDGFAENLFSARKLHLTFMGMWTDTKDAYGELRTYML
jgi:hypothetical protein